MEFFFGAADIVSQILNFGIPAPIDVQITGAVQPGTITQIATQIAHEIAEDARRGGRACAPGGPWPGYSGECEPHAGAEQIGLQQQAGRRAAVLISLVPAGRPRRISG